MTERLETSRPPEAPAPGTGPGNRRFRLPDVSRTAMRRFAAASLVGNIVLVVTGGLVRLTGSGLGCPTWPRCTAGSFVAHEALGIHGFIEYGNRMLTLVLTLVTVATWVAAFLHKPSRRSLRVLATVLVLGIPAQAVIGGISVLTDLNPWVVSFHLLFSLALVSVAAVLLRRVDETDGPARPTVPRAILALVGAVVVVTAAVLYVGTVVTGSGPHAGSPDSPRNGLDPADVSQLHADLVFLLIGLTVGCLLALRAVKAPERAQRAAGWLLALQLSQGVVGIVQYATGLPVALVSLHMLGAALIAAATTWLYLGTRDRGHQLG